MNPPSEPGPAAHAEREPDPQPVEPCPEPESQDPAANPEPVEEQEPQNEEPASTETPEQQPDEEPQPDEEQPSGGDQSHEDEPVETALTEPEPGPRPVASEAYLIFSFSYGAPPKVLHAFSNRDLRLLIRDLMRDEQQFLYIVRDGELARLLKTKRGLTVQFEEPKSRLRVPFAEQGRPVENGWMGETD